MEHHAFRQEQNSKGDQLQGTSAIACGMDWDEKGKAQDGATRSV
jgi:hypothetical protein